MQIPSQINKALEILRNNGFEAYLVGGCVRDALLNKTPDDYDITTNALPNETAQCFNGFHVIQTGLKHGTITVVIEHMPVEITTMRIDGEYSDCRRPDSVTFTRNIKDDLARRDFTVNAMAYGKEEILDFFGGKEDLDKGIIRAVGDAQLRFNEDALRILRALRFASKLGFEIEKNTAKAVHKLKFLLKNVSVERIFTEFKGIIGGKDAQRVMTEFSDVISEIIPEIEPCINFDQNNPHHIYDVYTHILKTMNEVDGEALKLAAFFHDIAKPLCKSEDEKGIYHFYGHPQKSAEIANAVLKRLKCDNKTREKVVALIKFHDERFPATERNVKRFVLKTDFETCRDIIKLKRADLHAQSPLFRNGEADLDEMLRILDILEEQNACLSLKELKVKGEDLMLLGLKGKKIGEALAFLLTQVVDGKIENEKNALLQKVRETENIK